MRLIGRQRILERAARPGADASRRREIDEVQTVIESQPHIRDDEVWRPVLQPLTRGWELCVGDHVSDRRRRAQEEHTSGWLRFDEQQAGPVDSAAATGAD